MRVAQGERDGVLTPAVATGSRVGEDLSGWRCQLAGLALAAMVEFGLAACVLEAQAVGRAVL